MNDININDGTTFIEIWYSESNNGYMYSIYDRNPKECDDLEETDGGICTGTMADAIIMASSQAGIIDINEIVDTQSE